MSIAAATCPSPAAQRLREYVIAHRAVLARQQQQPYPGMRDVRCCCFSASMQTWLFCQHVARRIRYRYAARLASRLRYVVTRRVHRGSEFDAALLFRHAACCRRRVIFEVVVKRVARTRVACCYAVLPCRSATRELPPIQKSYLRGLLSRREGARGMWSLAQAARRRARREFAAAAEVYAERELLLRCFC